MAGGPTTRTSFYTPRLLIDLTRSDDEDDSQYPILPVSPSQACILQIPRDFSGSNNESILPGIFDFGAGSERREDIHEVKYGAGSLIYRGAQSLGVNSLGSTRSPTSLQAQTITNDFTPNRRSMQALSRTADTHMDRCVSVVGNAAKRRKTNGGMDSRQLQHAMQPRPHLSTQDRGDLPATEILRVCSSGQSVIVPLANNTVSGVKRPHSTSRISAGGRIHKPKILSHRAGNVEEDNERTAYVLRNQVFKHIKIAISQHRESLTNMDCSQIGTKTAQKLVDHQSFVENLTANNWKLSGEYERKLSIRAQVFVDKYASEVFHTLSSRSRELYRKAESADEPTEFYGKTTTRPLSRDKRPWTNVSSSGSSEDDDEVFDGQPVSGRERSLPLNNQISRCYSSSPTTSFSNEPNDAISSNDIDSHYESKASSRVAAKQANPRELRSSKHPKPSLPQPAQPIDIARTVSVTDLKRDPILQDQKPNLGAIREVQALRLAGGHNSIARPYIRFSDREDIRRGCEASNEYAGRFLSKSEQNILQEYVLHIDFCLEELEFLCKIIQAIKNDRLPLSSDPKSQIIALMGGQESIISRIQVVLNDVIKMPGKELGRHLIRNRDGAAIEAFLRDAAAGYVTQIMQVIRFRSRPCRRSTPAKPSISSLIRQRETWGMAPFRASQGQQSFKAEISTHMEDALVRKSEWTDCCGDISTLSWTGDNSFICGATAHSDYHNMQYNKPGNLLVGSSSLDTLRAVADHRIIRPIVGSAENIENSLGSMRQTQDPWLYTSVVSTAHSEINGFTFTASFDKTVKVWKVSNDGSSINLCGTWDHDGKVNFVATSEHHEQVATASDVSNNAIRVYHFDQDDISDVPYDTYSGDKAQEQAQELQRKAPWAYFPATIQWGKSRSVENLLLVGYSPRSVTADESDIPEDKKNSGELCLWNVDDMSRIPISSARTQNVFEVIWHPIQPCFLAATSPCGSFEPETRTQIRLFAQNQSGSFLHIKTLDCPAFDINELTIMPNSSLHCYVTASCTDSNTYVWDTAQGDRPIHTLGHGDSLDNPIHDVPREVADTGVKFASWGKTVDRFYTGSSDGKVKAWNIRKPKGHAFIRTVVSVSGGISAGGFSKDVSKLLIGDATGKVHLLEIADTGLEHSSDIELASASKALRRPGYGEFLRTSRNRPKLIIPHPEPLPPTGFGLEEEKNEMTAQNMARAFLEEGQLTLHRDPGIGAIQGPNYSETQLYRLEAHENSDGANPLLPEWQARQRYEGQRQEENLKLPQLLEVLSSDSSLHANNMSLDFNLSQLSLSTQEALERDGADLDFEDEHMFDYDLMPRFEIFKKERKKHQKGTQKLRHSPALVTTSV